MAHAVLAHGEPVLHESGDRGWVQHRDGERGRASIPSGAAPTHRHAPGTLEHLQLAMSAAALQLTVAAVVVAASVQASRDWRAPPRPRWWLPEVPGAP